eukprot:TRINITY_DN11544_c0_g1_i1.p1 TRINITY_DN11544_c0_g1~~TRINITY_DN11544_c0_g1_i1.p1  ORF type:complete len:630 (+),score=176.20 TRINITY_DN11544_c0_g1_i1:107-1891(+)
MADPAKMSQALNALASRVLVERDNFIAFFTKKVNALSASAARPPLEAAPEMLRTRNAILVALGDMRRRILGAFEDAAAHVPGLPINTLDAQRDALATLTKELRSLRLKTNCGVKTIPVVATLAHGAERREYMDTVLKLGGAFCDRVAQQTVTHLVLEDQGGQEGRAAEHLQRAAEWGVRVVRPAWLRRSAEMGSFCDCDPYEVKPGSPRQRARSAAAARGRAAESPRKQASDLAKTLEGIQAVWQSATTQRSVTQRSQFSVPPAPAGAGAPQQRPASGQQRVPRVSRRDFTGDEPEGAAPAAKRPRGARGSANTPVDLCPSPEALRRASADPAPQPFGPVGTSSTGMDESQMVRWDDATGSAAIKRAVTMARVFQIAGTSAQGNKAEKDAVIAAIRQLGAEVALVPKHESRATHLINLNANHERTEKYLSFVAAGKWIMNKDFVLDSAKRGHWVDEEDYIQRIPGHLRVAEFRHNGGCAFQGWRCVLAIQPRIASGIAAILHAGGCEAVELQPSEAAYANATHVFSDSPAPSADVRAELRVPASVAGHLQGKVFAIEYLYNFLCHDGDTEAIRRKDMMAVRAVTGATSAGSGAR